MCEYLKKNTDIRGNYCYYFRKEGIWMKENEAMMNYTSNHVISHVLTCAYVLLSVQFHIKLINL